MRDKDEGGSTADVRFGSKADIAVLSRDVCFTPKSRHRRRPKECPLCAISRHHHLYSINSSARMRSDSGTSTPSLLAVLRFTSKLILAGNSTGRSAGLVPLRIWLTYNGAR